MAWIESHQEILNHPKFKRLCRRLQADRPTVLGHLHMLWYWCVDYADDGDLGRWLTDDVEDAMDWRGEPGVLAAALVETGWLDQDDEGRLSIHDWSEHAGRLVEKRQANRARQKVFRDKSRLPVYQRDGGRCRYCGETVAVEQFIVDHVVPSRRGGSDDPSNLVTACVACNTRKGNRTPEEANMPLLTPTSQPLPYKANADLTRDNALRRDAVSPRNDPTQHDHTKHNTTIPDLTPSASTRVRARRTPPAPATPTLEVVRPISDQPAQPSEPEPLVIPDAARPWHEAMTGEPDYVATTRLLDRVASYAEAGVDVGEEALKLRSWLASKQNGKKAERYSDLRALNWLKRARDDAPRPIRMTPPPTSARPAVNGARPDKDWNKVARFLTPSTNAVPTTETTA